MATNARVHTPARAGISNKDPCPMQGPELPLTDEHAWQSSPLPFPETAEDPLRSKSGTRLLRARAGHVGARVTI